MAVEAVLRMSLFFMVPIYIHHWHDWLFSLQARTQGSEGWSLIGTL